MSDPELAARERDFYRERVDAVFTGPEPQAWEARKGALDAAFAAGWAAGADPRDPGIVASLRDIAQLGVVMLESLRGRADGAPYRGAVVPVPLGLTPGEFDAGQWSTCLFAATAAQDAASAVRLSRVRFDAFVRGGPAGQAELAQALTAVWVGDGDVGGAVVAALERTDPSGLTDEQTDAALALVVPQAAVLDELARGSAPSATLADAAEKYAAYWAGQEPELLLAVELCGLTVLSRLLGHPADVHAAPLASAVVDADPATITACPVCAEPFDAAEQRCHWCATDLTADAPLELTLDRWLQEPRRPCGSCSSLVHAQALRCWSCRERPGDG